MKPCVGCVVTVVSRGDHTYLLHPAGPWHVPHARGDPVSVSPDPVGAVTFTPNPQDPAGPAGPPFPHPALVL